MAFYKTLLFHTMLLVVATLVIGQSALDSAPALDLHPLKGSPGGPQGKPPQGQSPQDGHQLSPDYQNPNSERRGPPQGGPGSPQGGQRPQSGGQGAPQGGQRPQPGDQGPPQGGQRPPQGGQRPPQSGQGPPQRTTCNYTQEAGRTCRSCTQALHCLPNNLGFIRDCRGAAPYCRNGACSPTPSPACSASPTAPADVASTAADVASSVADVATTAADVATSFADAATTAAAEITTAAGA